MAVDRRWRWIGWLILGIGTSIVAGGLALGWGSLRHVLYAERAEGSSAGTENKLEAFHSKTLPGFTVRLASLPATRVNHSCFEFHLAPWAGRDIFKNCGGKLCSQRQEMYGCVQSDPSIWMIEQFYQYRFAPISVPSQFLKGRDHPIKGCISFSEVTAFCTTTMFSGFGNVAVFLIHLGSHHSLASTRAPA